MNADEHMTSPVPRTINMPWWRVAMMNSIFNLSLPVFIQGQQLAAASTAWTFFAGLSAGGLLLGVIGAVTGAIGSMTRLSSYMLTRIAFGARGSVLVNVSLAISLLGWFGVNIDLFSEATRYLLGAYHLYQGPAWPIQMAGGALMTATTVIGLKAIDNLALAISPLLLVVAVMMLAAVLHVGSLQAVLARAPATGMSLGDNMSAIVGGSAIGAVIMPDLTRFVRHWRGTALIAFFTFVVSATAIAAIGGLAGLATGQSDMLKLMIGVGLGAGAFVTVIGGSWIPNALNLYSAVLSLSSSAPRLRRGYATLACGVGGTIAAFFNILDHFITFLFYLAILFVPVAGILAADVFVVRPGAYRGDDAVQRAAPYQWCALAAWALGAAVAVAGSRGVLTLTHIAAVDAILVAGLARCVLGWMVDGELRTKPAQ
ncbi:MAG: cytosine permease [Caulobacteraceae bacterium]|nr:cytosine permease [Caulobacteraceae bacterium]